MPRSLLTASVSASLAFTVMPQSSYAQSEVSNEDNVPTLAPVVVTSTQIERFSFHTPASVDVIDGELMRSGQMQVNLSESLNHVPGLAIQNRQNYAQDLQ